MTNRKLWRAARPGEWRAAAVAALFAVLALGSSAGAQDEPDAPAEPAETEPAGEETPAPPRSAGDADDVFIPTEEIAADEEVVFPVDI